MCGTKKILLHSIRIAVAIFAFTFLVNIAQAQAGIAPPDVPPRPVGTNPAIPICPIPGARFPNAPACIDVDQPPDAIGNGGAGNVIDAGANLGPLWFQALTVFETVAVVGPEPQTGGATFPGLGPSFNAISCFQCHSQPAVGGSSPGLDHGVQTPGFPNGNPQIGDAPNQAQLTAVTTAPAGFQPILSTDSAGNGNGPVREVRFPSGLGTGIATLGNPATVPAGAVAELFVVTPGIGAPSNCQITQEPFQQEIQANNVEFRIPIPTFGDGLVENTPDSELNANANAAQTLAGDLGIGGINFNVFNTSGNDQTITRFGWKAQNKSMLMFAGEASNVEMGVTNELFQNERTNGNGDCSPNVEPEDSVVVPPLIVPSGLNDPRTIGGSGELLATFGPSGVASEISSNIENFAVFMRLNAAPGQCAFNSGVNSTTGVAQCFSLTCTSATPGCVNPNPSLADVNSIQRGQALFGSLNNATQSSLNAGPATAGVATIGCVLCHSDFLVTTTSDTAPLNNATFAPFSDFALHTMDPQLADGVKQGNAGPQQFRSAPLWGIGQRLFFLHDGRTASLFTAIEDHCLPSGNLASPSEACQVIDNFNALPATCPAGGCTAGTASQEDLLHFLRSL